MDRIRSELAKGSVNHSLVSIYHFFQLGSRRSQEEDRMAWHDRRKWNYDTRIYNVTIV
jgi:hypothetical protein